MANRYLVATGNWNSTAVWSATAGGAGGASVPTVSDDVYIGNTIVSGRTVTLTADAICNNLHGNPDTEGGFGGTLILNGKKLQVKGNCSLSYMAADISNSILEVDGSYYTTAASSIISVSNSLIILNVGNTSNLQLISQYDYNDLRINLGVDTGSVTTLNIFAGNNISFRLLDIRSVNSESNIVNFTPDKIVTVHKFIAIGADSADKLRLKNNGTGDGSNCQITIPPGGSSYGQYVTFVSTGLDSIGGYSTDTPLYIGSNSDVSGAYGFIAQNPPKISTLIDPLTTSPGSNSNWTVTGTVSQITTGLGGGGYLIDSASSLVSTDTFDLVDSEIIFERVPSQNSGKFGVDGIGELVNSIQSVGAWEEFNVHPVFGGNSVAYYSFYETGGGGTSLFSYPISSSKFLKIKISSGNLIMQYSDDGITWTTGYTESIPASDLDLFRSIRIMGLDGTQRLGSIGMLPTPPTTKLLKQNGRFIKANGKYLKL